MNHARCDSKNEINGEMKKMLKTILVAATLALAALPAQASPLRAPATMMQAVYTGTIYNDDSYDYTGLFGSVGSLVGLGVTATFTYDPNIGDHSTDMTGEEAWSNSSQPGNYPPFIVSSQITIAGHSASTTGDYNSYARTLNSGDDGSAIVHISTHVDATSLMLSQISAGISVDMAPYDLNTPFSTDGQGGGQFIFARNGGETDYQAVGYFSVNHVSITNVSSTASAVPLPASFGMGLAALAGLVLMGRRRRAA